MPSLVKRSLDIIAIAQAIPSTWVNDEKNQTYVAYLFEEAARPELLEELPIKKAFMDILYAHDCLIWNINRENYHKSQINKIVGHPSYTKMTTRNSNTARKLAALCEEAERS